MTVFYAVLLAHFLSDFILQPNRLVAAKHARRVSAHLLHGAVVGVTLLTLAFAASGRAFVAFAVAAALLHALQDWGKEHLRVKSLVADGVGWLLADQSLHLLVLVALLGAFGIIHPAALVSAWVKGMHDPVRYEAALLVVLGTWAAGVMLRVALEPLIPRTRRVVRTLPGGPDAFDEVAATLAADLEIAQSELFVRASFWIGNVERVIVIAAIATSGAQGLTTAGLVVAAKSVFRWRVAHSDLASTQYFLLGTLLSIAVAVLDGLLLRHILH